MKPAQKLSVRNAITSYCLLAERSRLRWTYVEQRPFHGFGVPADQPHIADCSAYVSLSFNWAMHQTGIYLADPLGERYNGTGYTGTEYDFLKAHAAPVNKYLVGDVAIWGTPTATIHTAICRKAGTGTSALFSSNGGQSVSFNEDSPHAYTLAQAAQPLVGVFRHPALL